MGSPDHVPTCFAPSELCEQMVERLGGPDALRAATGLPISPYFSATKYLWMYENVLEVGLGERGTRKRGGWGHLIEKWSERCGLLAFVVPQPKYLSEVGRT